MPPLEEKLQTDPDVNIIICGDFNDSRGRDEQEEAAGVEDLIGKMVKPIMLEDGARVAIYNPILEHSDVI